MVNLKKCIKNKPKYVKERFTLDRDEQEALEEEHLNVHRRLYNHTEFTKAYPVNVFFGFSFLNLVKDMLTKSFKPNKECGKRTLYNRVPAIKWLKNYKREFFLPDFLAGITVGIMHIPQGMAYALLATLPPIYGLYTSFYPVLIYWIFGTSKQISLGTFAVISLMVASTITDLEPKYVPPVGFNASNITNLEAAKNYLSLDRNQARVMIAMANCFWVGVFQLVMSICQLGFITSYLSESMVNSFLAGCVIHVLTSQIKFLFGLKGLTPYVGAGKIPLTYIDIFKKLYKTNNAAVLISFVSMTVLAVVKTHINERFSKKMPAPFPIELLIVVFGTAISFLSKFSTVYHVDVIGDIPAGLPGPSIPPLFLIKDMLIQTFLTAIIAFAINFSLADLFAKVHRYKINITQELFAYGATNIFSGFFPCFTTGASLARSCVQNNAGGRTQMVSIYSSIIICIVLLFIAPLFKELPQACLASIIVVALKTLLIQMGKLPYYWKVNKLEFFQMLLTFLAVVFIDVDYGLFIGVGYHIIMHIVRSTQPYHTILGNIPGTELYKDIKLYKDAHQIHNIRIVRVQQELHATNSAIFKKSVYELTGVKPQDYLHIKMKIDDYKRRVENSKKPSRLVNLAPRFLKPLLMKLNAAPTNMPNFEKSKVYILSQEQKPKKFEVNGKDEIVMKVVVKPLQNGLPTQKTNLDQINYLTEYEKDEYEAQTQAAETESQIGAEDVHVRDRRDTIIDYDDKMNEEQDLSTDDEDDSKLQMPETPFKCLIIDCSPINFVDTVGVKTLKQIVNDFNDIGIKVYLAECNDALRDRIECMETAGRETLLDFDIIHLSIHGAVLHAQKTFRKKEIL